MDHHNRCHTPFPSSSSIVRRHEKLAYAESIQWRGGQKDVMEYLNLTLTTGPRDYGVFYHQVNPRNAPKKTNQYGQALYQ